MPGRKFLVRSGTHLLLGQLLFTCRAGSESSTVESGAAADPTSTSALQAAAESMNTHLLKENKKEEVATSGSDHRSI